MELPEIQKLRTLGITIGRQAASDGVPVERVVEPRYREVLASLSLNPAFIYWDVFSGAARLGEYAVYSEVLA